MGRQTTRAQGSAPDSAGPLPRGVAALLLGAMAALVSVEQVIVNYTKEATRTCFLVRRGGRASPDNSRTSFFDA